MRWKAAIRRTCFRMAKKSPADVIFMFPGGGAQYAGWLGGSIRQSPVFREEVDRSAPSSVKPEMGS